MDRSDFIKQLKLNYVPRWVIVDTIRDQSVAEHSYNVAMMALRFSALLNNYTTGVIDTRTTTHLALVHDREEAITGDIPSTAKDKKPVVMPQTEEDYIVRLCDIIEALAFIKRYGVNGNGSVIKYLSGKLATLVSVCGDYFCGTVDEEALLEIAKTIEQEYVTHE